MDPGPVTTATVAALVTGAPVLGAEIDLGYRVLAITIEPAPEAHPEPDADDARLQVLFHPVARVAAVLADTSQTPPVLRRFTEDHLVDVVAALDGRPGEWRFDGPPPQPETWAPELSMDGASTAPDGRSHHAVLDLDDPAGLRLRLAVWFDEVDVKRPDGSTVLTTTPGSVFG